MLYMRRSARWLDRFTFGGRMAGAVGLILVVTVLASLATAFTSRHAEPPLFELAALRPDLVFGGQVWRLLTWPFVEPSPLWLLFGCLFLWWFGRDLAEQWGSYPFLAVWFGLTGVSAIVTCLIALVDRAVLHQSYLGGFAISEAIVVAWGLWFPDRVVRLYMILPIRGYWLAWLTIGITVVFAVYSGWESYVPVLVADSAMVAWHFRRSIAGRWSSFRRASRDGAAKKKRRAVSAYLRVIEGGDKDPPPLPSELEGKIGRIIGSAEKRDPKKDG